MLDLLYGRFGNALPSTPSALSTATFDKYLRCCRRPSTPSALHAAVKVLAPLVPRCRTGQYAHARGSHRSADPARRIGNRAARWAKQLITFNDRPWSGVGAQIAARTDLEPWLVTPDAAHSRGDMGALFMAPTTPGIRRRGRGGSVCLTGAFTRPAGGALLPSMQGPAGSPELKPCSAGRG